MGLSLTKTIQLVADRKPVRSATRSPGRTEVRARPAHPADVAPGPLGAGGQTAAGGGEEILFLAGE